MIPTATIGLQLYSVRAQLARDLAGTLATVASLGYAEVEFAGYHDHSPADIVRALDSCGLRAPATHLDPRALAENTEALLDTAALVGHQYVVIPWWEEALRTPGGYRQLVNLLNRAGKLARDRDLKLAYHNHDFEFHRAGSWIPFDFLLQETDPAYVYFELDLYWAATCGRDPVRLFNDHPGRFPLLHIKDMDSSGRETDVGSGVIDFSAILAAADIGGVAHLFIERDNPEEPLASAGRSLGRLVAILGGGEKQR